MHKDTVLKVENLSKKFCRTLKRSMYYGMIDTARSMFGLPYDTSQLRKCEFWALENINFELRKGETLGIIGENGSGKSTLLRLITGIFPPDAGKISFRGRIGALIAVGAGFHPHMTGRENIYLNGTILGMTKKEIDAKYDEIVDFADIGEFLEAPVNTYSSGMRVRLGFAIAVHCEPDILLVDEVLSVGDLSFRNKSLRKMAELREKAKALIFISHNLEHVRNLCSKVIVMDKGRVVFEGETDEGIVFYEELSRKVRVKNNNAKNNTYHLYEIENDILNILNFGIINEKNQKEVDSLKIDSALNGFLSFEIKNDIEEICLAFALRSEDGRNIIWVNSNDFQKNTFKNIKKGKYMAKIKIEKHHLGVGVYFLSFSIVNPKTMEIYTKVHSQKSFRVISDGASLERGFINIQEKWTLEKQDR